MDNKTDKQRRAVGRALGSEGEGLGKVFSEQAPWRRSPNGENWKLCSSTMRTPALTTSASWVTPACSLTSVRAASMPSTAR